MDNCAICLEQMRPGEGPELFRPSCCGRFRMHFSCASELAKFNTLDGVPLLCPCCRQPYSERDKKTLFPSPVRMTLRIDLQPLDPRSAFRVDILEDVPVCSSNVTRCRDVGLSSYHYASDMPRVVDPVVDGQQQQQQQQQRRRRGEEEEDGGGGPLRPVLSSYRRARQSILLLKNTVRQQSDRRMLRREIDLLNRMKQRVGQLERIFYNMHTELLDNLLR